MSTRNIASCDACNTMAPDDYSTVFPRRSGWFVILGDGPEGKDFCSFECVARWLVDCHGVKLPAKRRAAAKPKTTPVDELGQRRRHRAG